MERLAIFRRHKGATVAVVALTVLAALLVVWVVTSPKRDTDFAGPAPVDELSSTPPAPLPSLSPSPSATAATPGALGGPLQMPKLPVSSKLDPAGLPKHAVRIVVTSDSPIRRFGWQVAYGPSSETFASFVKSPAIIEAVGKGYGAQAVAAAQAGPFATYISCSITVDGKQRVKQTVKGPWEVVVCVG